MFFFSRVSERKKNELDVDALALSHLSFFFLRKRSSNPEKQKDMKRLLLFLVLAACAACALGQESSQAPSPQREWSYLGGGTSGFLFII